MSELERVWKSSKSLFHHKKVEETFNAELPNANLRGAIIIIAVATLLSSGISAISTVEAAFFGAYEYNVVSEVADIGHAEFEIEPLIPFILFQLFFLAPFSLIYVIGFEGVTFKILKLIGGKADFSGHLYLSAIGTLALAMASILILLAPLPYIQFFAAVGLILFTVYFVTYVTAKAYEAAHKLPLLHVIAVVVLMLVPRLVLMQIILKMAAGFFGIPEVYEISGV
jgi:hypothetical protein